MAKNKKDKEAVEEKEKSGGGIVSVFIVIAIVLIWLFVLAFVIKSDWGGFGSSLRPILKDVPVINKVLPKDTSEDAMSATGYPYKNMAEAVARIAELESQLNQITESNTSGSSTIAELQAQVERLQVFEDNQKEFEERVREFDNNVVFNDNAPDISEYAKYYEGINQENAEEIYRQVVERQQYDAKIAKRAEEYAKMKPDKAAERLEVMTGDLDLVAAILDSMSTTKSALILENMSPEMSAQLTKKLTSAD